MRPWEKYADGPWSRYADKPNTAVDAAKSLGSGVVRAVGDIGAMLPMSRDSRATAVRGAAWVSEKLGLAEPGTYDDVDAAAKRELDPGSFKDRANRLGADYEPQTQPGRYAKTAGEFSLNAFAGPAGAARRIAQVVVPAVASEGAGQAVEAMGGNALAQSAARVGGAVVGGVASGIRPRPRNPENRPVNVFAERQGATAQEMRDRANAFRANDIEPTLIDVTDDAGRGVVRATASRMTPARQGATDFRDARALNLPGRISRQSRRTMSADPRTPDQIRGETAAARRTNANAAYGAVRGERLGLAPATVDALRTQHGRDAIREAARRERDPAVRAELNRLADAALDNPGGTEITIGMADRIARTLQGRAQAAARQGDNDLATFFGDLSRDVRGPARQSVPGYDAAVRGYEADSRLVDAAETGEQFMSRNTDEFVGAVGGMDDGERALATAAARRAVERKAGENISAAPGVARQLADAPEQQARNAALLGPQRAGQMQEAMRLEERAVRNANDIAPRTGSQTDLRGADRNAVSSAVNVAGNVATGNVVGLAARAADWLRSRGLSDVEAQRLTEMALDPAQLDDALRIIEARLGPDAARQFLDARQRLLIGTSGMASMGASAEER